MRLERRCGGETRLAGFQSTGLTVSSELTASLVRLRLFVNSSSLVSGQEVIPAQAEMATREQLHYSCQPAARRAVSTLDLAQACSGSSSTLDQHSQASTSSLQRVLVGLPARHRFSAQRGPMTNFQDSYQISGTESDRLSPFHSRSSLWELLFNCSGRRQPLTSPVLSPVPS